MGRTITPELDAEVVERLHGYALEFRPLFPRSDQFKHGRVYLHGLLLDGERKSIEPLSRSSSSRGPSVSQSAGSQGRTSVRSTSTDADARSALLPSRCLHSLCRDRRAAGHRQRGRLA